MAEQVPDLEAVESPPRRELDYNRLVFDEDPIGGGGQGIVYRAEISDRGPPDEVAVKEPAINSSTLQKDEVEAFLEEAATWETVDRREREKLRWRDSEHIVGVVDTGDDLPWMALEYMDGGGLDDRLEANSDGLPVAEALWIGERVCRGVEIAHNYGIAHLDLKPANILFRETPPDVWDVPKIADWGLARVLAERTGTMEGLSVQYAAPEQFEPGEFGDPDMLTDVYQVGALVHALLTGDPPYTGSQLSVMRDVVSDERPVLPSAARESLPNVVDETVLIALETKKIDRYPTIELLKQALRAARIGEQFPSIVTQRIDISNNEVGESPDVETAEVSVEVVDDIIGKTYPHADRVIARHETPSGQGLQRGIITDSTRIGLTKGEGKAELAHGTWVFHVEQNGEMIGQRRHKLEHRFESDHIALAVDPHVVEAVVTDVPNWKSLRGTGVEARADAGGWTQQKPTDPEGRVRFEVPRSASTVSFTVTHEDYPPAESEHRIEEAAEEELTLSIRDGLGAMTVETTVGDRAWPSVGVDITPISPDAGAYTDEGTVATASNGRQTIEGLPTGEYEVTAHPQVESVETTAAVERVTVEDGGTVEVALPIGISYTMSTAQQDRIEELEDRIEGLAAASNRDVAIPQYYGTVLTSVLELAADVESAPERALEMGVSPDATVNALLDATEAGIRAVDAAMSERRNVKLFDACESMPAASADWNGAATLDAFFDRVAEGGDHERRALRDRLRAVDEVLDRQWGEVNEIGPARKVYDRIGDLARETGDIDDELAVVAQTYVGICLLDAVEEVFDHGTLVNRLNNAGWHCSN